MTIENAISSLLAEVTPVPEKEQVSLCCADKSFGDNNFADTKFADKCLAIGRILAEEVRAPFNVPHFPKSAMDGYAVHSEDVKDATSESPVILTVIGEILAGDDPASLKTVFQYPSSSAQTVTDEQYNDRSYQIKFPGSRGTAVRIMTGAAIPDGYDAVVKQEDTDYGETKVTVYHGVSPFMNYCKVGEDIKEGSVVLPKGRRIGRVEAGVLASLGISKIMVVRPIRVSILSTGSELIELSTDRNRMSKNEDPFAFQPPAGKIYNSIACTLTAGLPAAVFQVDQGVCPDDPDEILQRLTEALDISDVVITTGGVSVGKRDLIPEVLGKVGAKKVFSGVDIQPGTPTIGSVKDGKVILSLSGNPYAALVNFDLYFWEVAAKLTGCSSFLPERREAELASEYTKVNRHRRILRAKEENGKVYLPVKSHASSVLSNLLDCNCYIDLPAGKDISVGDRVQILRMPE